MVYLILAVIAIALLIMIIKFFKSGGKEFQPKLSYRERAELESKLEKGTLEPPAKPIKEKHASFIKSALPSKNIKDELNRFKTFFDIENDKITHLIRNGIQKSNDQNYNGALEDFSHAVEIKPLEPTGYYCRGLTNLMLKNFESSIADFTESITLQMKELNALYYRGLANYDAGAFNRAIRDFSSYLNTESNYAEAYFNLALCYKQLENNQEAINYLSLAIEKNPRHEAAYFERGMIKNKMDDREGCCSDLKKAMEMGHLESYHYIKDLCRENNRNENFIA